jgi:hypothetical protein
MTREKVLIFLSTVFTSTDIYSNFSEIQKISKCLGFVIASFVNRSSLISFGGPLMALFDSISLLFLASYFAILGSFLFFKYGLFYHWLNI